MSLSREQIAERRLRYLERQQQPKGHPEEPQAAAADEPAAPVAAPAKPSVDELVKILTESCSCPICLTLVVHCVVMPCGHMFCRECLYQWTAQVGKRRCPKCRRLYRGRLQEVPVVDDMVETYTKLLSGEEYEGYKQRVADSAEAHADHPVYKPVFKEDSEEEEEGEEAKAAEPSSSSSSDDEDYGTESSSDSEEEEEEEEKEEEEPTASKRKQPARKAKASPPTRGRAKRRRRA